MTEDASSSAPPIRLMNFVSEEQLDRIKKTRGERVEDGTAQRDRPLFEILRENKDKKDAEFNERFKHMPPKALDEDETEFLDKLAMSRKEYERQQAMEEAEQLKSFQEAVAARSSIVHEIKETPMISGPMNQEHEQVKKNSKKSHHPRGSLIISVKPITKKAKTETICNDNSCNLSNAKISHTQKPPISLKNVGSLVSYSDESDDDN
ncbi:putative NEFA-interacting nuclear protein NIP30 [Zostera marina]|uniref:Putative NEFA-interacting nuclear protein NIP30 n=1 Tax=Zostera marina TaxID=29655 RepID=A0A0K9PSX8_ZOSMR|nr:putative NEFA-interacting nuclear protein NIP30 [Zostera marina]